MVDDALESIAGEPWTVRFERRLDNDERAWLWELPYRSQTKEHAEGEDARLDQRRVALQSGLPVRFFAESRKNPPAPRALAHAGFSLERDRGFGAGDIPGNTTEPSWRVAGNPV